MRVQLTRIGVVFFASTLPVLGWLGVKYGFQVSDRYLPAPSDVMFVFVDERIGIVGHALVTLSRIVFALVISTVASLWLGVMLFRSEVAQQLALPTLQSLRAIPAAATVPFFILWFGFSEMGRVVLFVVGISFNLVIAILQILKNIHEKYRIAFRGFHVQPSNLPMSVIAPFAVEKLLPTMRFSVTVLIGLSVIAELLGAQSGLGYLIQSARTTYALDVVVACALLYGLITVVLDSLLRALWYFFVPWQRSQA